MSEITSVRLDVKKPRRIYPVALLLASLFLVLRGGHGLGSLSVVHWAIVLLPGLIWLAVQRTQYTVTLNSSSGENRAIISKDQSFVLDVVRSLNDAIIKRG